MNEGVEEKKVLESSEVRGSWSIFSGNTDRQSDVCLRGIIYNSTTGKFKKDSIQFE